MILTVAECPYRIVARRSAGIVALADLRGTRIGVMRKSSVEYFLDRMLRTTGLTADDVTLVPFMAKTAAPLTHLPQALRNGALDAMTVWEPQLTGRQPARRGRHRVLRPRRLPRALQLVYHASES